MKGRWIPTILREATWGRAGSRTVSGRYEPSWLETIRKPWRLLRLGFALYDERRDEESRSAFAAMEALAGENRTVKAIALVWQGHVLDLAGRREEALRAYRAVVAMNARGKMTHSQYGMTYDPYLHAKARLEEPFERVENLQPE